MNLFLQLLLLVLITSSFFFIQRIRKNGSKPVKPPGPAGLPLIGNLHQFASSCPHLYLHQLSKTYGPLMSLKLGLVPTLVVSSAKMAKEVMKTQDQIFCGRPVLAAQQKISYNCLDITFAPYGDYWRDIKKLCILHLFSSKKVQSFSPIREEEVYKMTQKISRLAAEDRPVDLSEMMFCLTSTVICRTAFGRRYDSVHGRDGSSFQSMIREVEEMAVSFCLSDYFPFMGWVDKLRGMPTYLHKLFVKLDSFLEEIIYEHMQGNRPNSGQEDIVDVLLKIQRENSFAIELTLTHLKAIIVDVVVAGIDTGAGTVVWAMTELMKNPKAMKRVQEEVRTLMGNKNIDMIKEEDVEKLVYLKAVVKETLRLLPIAPLLIPQETTQKCNIEGYEIQEKTLVFVNAWAIGRDPEFWENLEEFKPERFLSNKPIDFRGQHFQLIPFGAGRRICPGLQMGVALVELALANLICLFDWAVPEGMEKEVVDMSASPGITMHKKIPLHLQAKNVWH